MLRRLRAGDILRGKPLHEVWRESLVMLLQARGTEPTAEAIAALAAKLHQDALVIDEVLYPTIIDACRKLAVNYVSVMSRIMYQNETPVQAISHLLERGGRGGIKAQAKRAGIPYPTVLQRMKKGASLQEALSQPNLRQRVSVSVAGVSYSSQGAACRALGLVAPSVSYRMRNFGETFEQAAIALLQMRGTETTQDACKRLGIKYSSVMNRVHQMGETHQQAIEHLSRQAAINAQPLPDRAVLERRCQELFGESWPGALARVLEVNTPTVYRWKKGTRTIPRRVFQALDKLEAERNQNSHYSTQAQDV
jgi:hypothetical protein